MKSFFAGLYYSIFGIIMSIPFAFIRSGWLRLNLKHLGAKTFIMRNVEFMSPQRISIGKRTVINKGTLIDGRGGIYIGNDVDIARDVIIWSCSHDVADPNHATFCSSVRIDDHVWIGARSSILPGITIGKGAVIGTGSIVTKNVPPNTIVAGNPAKKIRMRDNKLEYQLNFHPWFT